jgi:hypothetical protein
MDITKNLTITLPGGLLLTAQGQGKVFATADSNALQMYDNPPSSFFALNGAANSLNTITADVQLGDYRGLAQATAGKVTGGATVSVPVTLRARTQWSDNPPPFGGFAAAFSLVRIRGGNVTVNSVTTKGVTVTGAAQIPPIVNGAKDKGAFVVDPIHLFAQNLVTNETVDTDVYTNTATVRAGGSVGFNLSNLLELKIPDTPTADTLAQFVSSTLVPFATDLTGTAKLVDGILTATGVFYPDTTRPITDFWSLTFAPGNPSFIDDALFLGSSQFATINISSPFTNPATSGSDPIILGVDASVMSAESSIANPNFLVSEPDSLALLGCALVSLLAFTRRVSQQHWRG